ncbi:MAG TPA: transketolase, partial [Bacteroidales bacterium]|nr:transketolase [Bacteroidales bacterium]
IWTHDAFRVGEDGPTHEPVEQEAQIRLMEHLQNHSGNNSMLVLRPADALETNEAWRLALENAHTPSALILSRQNIPSLPDNTEYHNVANGAYIVSEPQGKPDIVLIASGSEVSTLVAGNELLKQHGVKARIVSVPSEGLLRKQTADYQHQLLPLDIPRFGLTAGLPVTLLALVGNINNIWGLQSFGFSAPYKVLDEKLGFTADNVCKQVLKILDK